MINLVEMPGDTANFNLVERSISLRAQAFENKQYRIGQTATKPALVSDIDRLHSSHLVSTQNGAVIGYMRLQNIGPTENSSGIDTRIFAIAHHKNKLPAFELQCASLAEEPTQQRQPLVVLRDLMLAAFRYCNTQQSRFLFTVCDRNASSMLRSLGMRYTTMSPPFVLDEQILVVVCIPVTNSNYSSLDPLKPVDELDSEEMLPPIDRMDDPDIFCRMDVLAELMAE